MRRLEKLRGREDSEEPASRLSPSQATNVEGERSLWRRVLRKGLLSALPPFSGFCRARRGCQCRPLSQRVSPVAPRQPSNLATSPGLFLSPWPASPSPAGELHVLGPARPLKSAAKALCGCRVSSRAEARRPEQARLFLEVVARLGFPALPLRLPRGFLPPRPRLH